MPGSRDGKDLVRRLFDEVLNEKSKVAAREVIATGFVGHHPARPQFHGPDGLLEVMGMFWSEGTHSGAFMGVRPTQRLVGTTGTDVFRVVDGQIVEAWVISDLWGLLHQLQKEPS